MQRIIELELGDRLALTNEETLEVSVIDIEGPRKGKVRLKLNLSEHTIPRIIKLDSRIASDPRVASESEPSPVGSTRVASALQIAEAHEAVDHADELLSEPPSICNGVIHGNTAHPFVDPNPGRTVRR
ncbi:MAG: hypothetical protein AAF085_14745 [Planctomycetota bacterium]